MEGYSIHRDTITVITIDASVSSDSEDGDDHDMDSGRWCFGVCQRTSKQHNLENTLRFCNDILYAQLDLSFMSTPGRILHHLQNGVHGAE